MVYRARKETHKEKHFVISRTDDLVLKKILEESGYTLQAFTEAIISSLLRGDPHMMKILKDHQMLCVLPKEETNDYVISHRERVSLYEEFEKNSKL